MKFQIYVDYDEDPKLGGQQGVFHLNDDTQDLIGSRIVDIKFNEEELENSFGQIGRTLIFTLEK